MVEKREGKIECLSEIMPRVLAQIEEKRRERMKILERNWGLIPEELQEKIKQAKILLVGCGLGSQIAVLAARTGFCYFELWDGDVVEVHNLNRQAFNQLDVGLNKAEMTAKKIQSINIEAYVNVYPKFLRKPEEIKLAVDRNDFIINMADPNEAMWIISETAQEQGKIEIHPLNIGWIGYCLVLTPERPSLEEIIDGKISGLEFYKKLAEKTLGPFKSLKGITDITNILNKYGQEILLGQKPFPQLGITTYLTSVIVVEAMVKLLAGEEIPLAPEPIVCF